MARKFIGEQLKKEIREYYLSKPMGLDELKRKYSLSTPTLIKILGDTKRWRKCNVFNPEMVENYFENIDTEAKAYFIGLLIADGNVFDPKDGRSLSTSITLGKNDIYMLERFKKELKVNTSVVSDGRGCYYIAVRSNKIAEDLSKYGIKPRKTLDTYLPININEDLMKHLFRGIMDGDGNITIKKTSRRHMHSVSFCGTHRLMKEMSEYLYNKLQLSKLPKVYDYSDRKLSEFKLQSIDSVSRFLKWIYEDSTIFLERKRVKYNEFREFYSL